MRRGKNRKGEEGGCEKGKKDMVREGKSWKESGSGEGRVA